MVGFPLIMGILIEWYKDRDRAKYYKKCSKKNENLPIPARNGLFSFEIGAKTCRQNKNIEMKAYQGTYPDTLSYYS